MACRVANASSKGRHPRSFTPHSFARWRSSGKRNLSFAAARTERSRSRRSASRSACRSLLASLSRSNLAIPGFNGSLCSMTTRFAKIARLDCRCGGERLGTGDAGPPGGGEDVAPPGGGEDVGAGGLRVDGGLEVRSGALTLRGGLALADGDCADPHTVDGAFSVDLGKRSVASLQILADGVALDGAEPCVTWDELQRIAQKGGAWQWFRGYAPKRIEGHSELTQRTASLYPTPGGAPRRTRW